MSLLYQTFQAEVLIKDDDLLGAVASKLGLGENKACLANLSPVASKLGLVTNRMLVRSTRSCSPLSRNERFGKQEDARTKLLLQQSYVLFRELFVDDMSPREAEDNPRAYFGDFSIVIT